jgi:MFS family permease
VTEADRSFALPRVVKSLGWVSLFTDVATEMVYPLLPVFLVSIGAGAQTLGLMEGLAEGVSAGLKWLSGRASDTRARKPYVLAGYALATAVRPLLALATSGWQVIAIRTTDRIGKGIRTAPRDALVAAAVPAEHRGHAFGFHNMMDNIGAAIGPLLAFVLVRGFDVPLRTVFALTIIPGLFAVGVIVWGVDDSAPAHAPVAVPVPVSVPAAATEPVALPTPPAATALPGTLRAYLALVALFTLGASADSFLMLRLSDLGLAAGWIPVAWISLNASKALVNIPGGKLSDRLGRGRTQVAGWLVYALVYALFPLTRSIAATWAILVAYGAYYGLTEGGEKALVADLAPAAVRGRAFGALHAVTGLAVLPANALFGALYARHVEIAFFASAACAGAAAVGLAVVVANRPRATSSAPT